MKKFSCIFLLMFVFLNKFNFSAALAMKTSKWPVMDDIGYKKLEPVPKFKAFEIDRACYSSSDNFGYLKLHHQTGGNPNFSVDHTVFYSSGELDAKNLTVGIEKKGSPSYEFLASTDGREYSVNASVNFKI